MTSTPSTPLVDLPAPPIAREGVPFIVLFFVMAALLTGLAGWLLPSWAPWGVGMVTGALCLWCVWFFRDPKRAIPADPRAVVSPADGVICAVDHVAPPAELELPAGTTTLRICVFMNVFDVHVNRAPVAGKVVAAHYRPGAFVNAAFDKASELNERHSIVIEDTKQARWVVVQIAGLVARRIVPRAVVGSSLAKAERFGIIRFGSRVDVHLPPGTSASVSVGQRAKAGSSVIAMMNA